MFKYEPENLSAFLFNKQGGLFRLSLPGAFVRPFISVALAVSRRQHI